MLNKNGFTIVELLITMTIVVSVGSIMSAILVSTLRNSAKATIIGIVKNNGDYAVSFMSKSLRNARVLNNTSAVCGNPPPSGIQSITFTDINSQLITYACDNVNNTLTSSINGGAAVSLLDTNAVKIISNTCSFSCIQNSPSDYPIIQIIFSLSQKNTSALEENSAFVPFQTTVDMRNIIR